MTDSMPPRRSEQRDLLVLHSESVRHGEHRLHPSDNHVYFDAVARHGSIRKAAHALHIASSALNRRILDLEEQVGTALFERLPRGVRLTAAGEMLLAYVRFSLKELRKVEAQIDQLRGQMRGVVRIAVAESATVNLLPEAIADYQAGHPGVAFHVSVAGPNALLDALVRDEADLILTHDEQDRPMVSVLATTRHPLCALVSLDHPLANRESVTLSDCAPYPLAMPDHTLAARALIDLALEESNLPLRPSFESDSIETLKSYARLGKAVGFSFRLGPSDSSPGLALLELRDQRCQEARLYLAARRGRVLPVAAAAFAEQLKLRLGEFRMSQSVSVA